MGFFLSILWSCKHTKPKFGLEANENRKKVGLEILPGDWKAISVGKDYTIWKNPIGDKLLQAQKPVFFSKSVKYDQQVELISEEDLYYSGKKIATIDGHESETVSIKYYFQRQELANTEVIGWFCIYNGNKLLGDYSKENNAVNNQFIPRRIDITTADSILKEWGFKTNLR